MSAETKLFEVIGVKRNPDTTAQEMVDNMLEAAYETMDELFPDGPASLREENRSFECKTYHEGKCVAVPARDFSICECQSLRMEVHLIGMDEAMLKVAQGILKPVEIQIDGEAN